MEYAVFGLGYDKDNCVTDDEIDFGTFITKEEAVSAWRKAVYNTAKIGLRAFENTDVYNWLIQVEEVETDDEGNSTCVDVICEKYVSRPNNTECNKRMVIALIEVDDTLAERMDAGPIELLEVVTDNIYGIKLTNARLLDDDDPEDSGAIAAATKIFL